MLDIRKIYDPMRNPYSLDSYEITIFDERIGRTERMRLSEFIYRIPSLRSIPEAEARILTVLNSGQTKNLLEDLQRRYYETVPVRHPEYQAGVRSSNPYSGYSNEDVKMMKATIINDSKIPDKDIYYLLTS